MIVCPEFTLEPKLYDTVLPYLSIVALILNPYVIYCIIWRSTSHMKIYRWFLLYHQILTFITDISVRSSCQNYRTLQISFLTKPVILLPLPMGYNSGYLRGILSPLAIQSIFVLLVEFSFASILHLFAYRYETGIWTKGLFPAYMVIMMVIGYSTSLIVPIASLFMEQQSSKTVEMLRNVSVKGDSGSCLSELHLCNRWGSIHKRNGDLGIRFGHGPRCCYFRLLVRPLYFHWSIPALLIVQGDEYGCHVATVEENAAPLLASTEYPILHATLTCLYPCARCHCHLQPEDIRNCM